MNTSTPNDDSTQPGQSEPDGEFFLTYAGTVMCDKCGRIGNEDDLAFDDEECPDEDCDGICHAYEQEGTT